MHQSIDKKNKIVIYLIFLFVLSTTNEKFSEKKKNYLLKIDEIQVVGLSNNRNLEIKNELSKIFYQNILIVGKREINKIINKHAIIEEYNIKKIYPSTLNINIKPTKFVAKLTSDNHLIVGANGKIISGEKNYQELPYIYGKFNSKKFLEFKKNVDLSKLNFSNLKTLYFFPSNRWDILTNDNVLIKLPQKNVSQALNFAHKTITSTDLKDKKIFDLRIKNHLIVK